MVMVTVCFILLHSALLNVSAVHVIGNIVCCDIQ